MPAPTARKPWFLRRPLFAAFAVILVIGGIASIVSSADRDESGKIAAAGDIDVDELRVGDCFNQPSTDTVLRVEAVPCSEPHDNEVYAFESIGDSLGSEYPERAVVVEFASQLCVGSAFEAYVAMPYQDSVLDVRLYTPSPLSWENGDREVTCILYQSSLPLSSSAPGSGL